MKLSLAALLTVSFLLFSHSASAEYLCLKNNLKIKNAKVNLKKGVKVKAAPCAAKETQLLDTSTFLSADTPVNNEVIAFVNVKADGTVKNFGGLGTTSVEMTKQAPGMYIAKFSGNYPELSGSDLLTISSTATADNWGVSNATVNLATPTQIEVTFFTWYSNTAVTTHDSAGASLVLFKGKAQ